MDLAHKMLLADEELSALLLLAYLVESHHPQLVPPEAMKERVGTTSSSANSSNKMGSLKKCLLGPVLLPSVQKRKSQNSDYTCL